MAPHRRNLKNSQQDQEGGERGEMHGQDSEGMGETSRELEAYKTWYGEEKKTETREHVRKCHMHKTVVITEVKGQSSQAMNLVDLTTTNLFFVTKPTSKSSL
jgi:hypothetical protein